jgi:hypothetical protein
MVVEQKKDWCKSDMRINLVQAIDVIVHNSFTRSSKTMCMKQGVSGMR